MAVFYFLLHNWLFGIPYSIILELEECMQAEHSSQA